METRVGAAEGLNEAMRRWEAAELARATAELDQLATDDFRLVGPRGFVLDRQQWLARYESGDLVNNAFTWTAEEVRIHGDTGLVIGVQTQDSAYRSRPAAGSFRVTQVWGAVGGGWKLASLQLSPMPENA